MSQSLIIVTILLLLVASSESIEPRMDLDRHEYFSKVDINVSWSINIQTQKIYVEILAPIDDYSDRSYGWIAFGISDTGGIETIFNPVKILCMHQSSHFRDASLRIDKNDKRPDIFAKSFNFSVTKLFFVGINEKSVSRKKSC